MPVLTDIAWDTVQARYDELSHILSNPALDTQKRQQLQKEQSHLGQLLDHYKVLKSLTQRSLTTEQDALKEQDPDLKQLYQVEQEEILTQIKEAELQLENILYPPDPLDNRPVFLEIRAGAGGQEAALFVADLLKMYTNYALSQGWRVSLISESSTDLKGYREVVINIQGSGVYGQLKYESGVHRVQRVPATETAGRIHTSTATVAVLPEADEVDVVISPTDLRIDVFRSGGAGGQHVNTTDSAVRITHLPTGLVVSCQDERSQHKNKAKAMKMLQSRLLARRREQEEEARSKQRKEQIGTGMRAEKVRTYNYPQNRITDHQVDLTVKNLDMVMEGQLDDIIQALVRFDQEKRKKQVFTLS